MATITYFIVERPTKEAGPYASGDFTSLRIIDRKTILVSTHYGCVYIDRTDAARMLREVMRRQRYPFEYNGHKMYSIEIDKKVTT